MNVCLFVCLMINQFSVLLKYSCFIHLFYTPSTFKAILIYSFILYSPSLQNVVQEEDVVCCGFTVTYLYQRLSARYI